MLTSCFRVIAAGQACIKVVVRFCTTAVATLSLPCIPLLYTGSMHESVVDLCGCVLLYRSSELGSGTYCTEQTISN